MTDLKLPTGKQRTAILAACQERLTIWDGSVQSGKTMGSLWAWAHRVKTGPHGNRVMSAKTERTLKRNILDPLTELVGSENMRVVGGIGEAYLFGKRIYIVGANDERAESKLRGMSGVVDFYGDELSTWPESFFQMALSRMSHEESRFLGTTNPDAPLHWLKAGYLDRADELSLRHDHFTLDDNPTLPQSYVDNLKREYRGLWYKRFIQGLWVAAEGAIYDMLDLDRLHVDHLPRLVRHWIGVDYGTTNPTVYVPFSLGEDGIFYFHHEYRWDSQKKGRQKTNVEYSQDMRKWLQNPCAEYKCNCRVSMVKREATYVDPSEPQFRLQLKRDNLGPVWPADNTVIDGIRNMATLLDSGLVRFHKPTTQELVAELLGYSWDPKAQKMGEDKPIKVKDHGCDASRYVVRATVNIWRRKMPSELQKQLARQSAA